MRRIISFIISNIALVSLYANSYSNDSIKLETINNDIVESLTTLSDYANNNTKAYKKQSKHFVKLTN